MKFFGLGLTRVGNASCNTIFRAYLFYNLLDQFVLNKQKGKLARKK
jgi:hypothetical protein